jgi:hypothetical protein
MKVKFLLLPAGVLLVCATHHPTLSLHPKLWPGRIRKQAAAASLSLEV